jgi:hypothetical protein
MPTPETTATVDPWAERARAALTRYDEDIVRLVAGRLVKPRGHWPVDDLVERSLAALRNAPGIDRRLKELPPACRKLLALLGVLRRPDAAVGPLLSLLAALGHTEGVQPLLTLFEEGLLFPDLPEGAVPLRAFEGWLGQAAAAGVPLHVFTLPLVAERARGTDLGLPAPPTVEASFTATAREADGLDWPVRMAVVWQQVAAAPLRRTQNHDFFKRDLARLRGDPLLAGPGAEALAELPDTGPLAVLLAHASGLLREQEGELTAADFPPAWNDGLFPTLTCVWTALPEAKGWQPVRGWVGPGDGEDPYPAAGLLCLLLLARLPETAWARPADLEAWVREHHPFWAGRSLPEDEANAWAAPWLLGLAYPLKIVQATTDPDAEGGWLVRLSPYGRWLLAGGPPPAAPPAFRQTLLVQPNYEVIAYRQGLTPSLLASLSHVAAWKSAGAACMLELNAEQVYRGLELGQTLESVMRLLNQHGMRQVPDAVADGLRTWSNKRERIVVYPRALLLEFASAAELEEAASRGLIGVRLTDRLALVSDESQMQYRHFRLTGNRDYAAPPERCLDVDDDGLTLAVDAGRADLLLETELARLTEPLPAGDDGRRRYRLTQATLRKAVSNGFPLPVLDEWFVKRSGEPLSPAARLLATATQQAAPRITRAVVVEVADEATADGLVQWPVTGALIERRLGPTALLVADENVGPLRERMDELGLPADGG